MTNNIEERKRKKEERREISARRNREKEREREKNARLNLHLHDTYCQVCQLSPMHLTMIVDILVLNYVSRSVLTIYLHISNNKRITDVISHPNDHLS